MGSINHDLRVVKLASALLDNHERIKLRGDVRLVRFAFIVNDPKGRRILKAEQVIEHAKLLKSLIRVYLNKYRRRRSGKRVMGYSWVMHSEQHRHKPYLHILFYVSPDTYDEIMPEPHNEVQVMPSEGVRSVISDLGYYWTVICNSLGVKGAAINYNIEKKRHELSYGDHKHVELLKEMGLSSDFIITDDINGGSLPMIKLDVEAGKEEGYLKQIAKEAYFIPGSRSFGISYRDKKKVSKNEPLTIPDEGCEEGIKNILNDD